METLYLKFDELQRLVAEILVVGGLSKAQADAMATVMTTAEQDHCKSHGIYRILGTIKSLQGGVVVGDAEPEVFDTPHKPIVKVDAKGGFAPLAFDKGFELLVEKTQRYGIGAMAINHCVHFSALWPEVERFAARGLAALAMCPSAAYVAPAGGIRKLLGTNPFAFAWPCTGGNPYVFDFATSVAARGEVELYKLKEEELPDGWGIDGNGRPTNDPEAVLNDGALLTFGGYKGSAFSTMIEILGGVLIGDFLSIESSEFDNGRMLAPRHGELIITISPDAFGCTDTVEHTRRLLNEFEQQGARLPSQRRYQEREKSLAKGIPISSENFARLQKMKAGDFSENVF